MLQLYYYPSTAAMVPHILLEEIGVPYQRGLVDRMQGAHKTPDYLKLNPNGLIPVLIDADLVLYETAAICLHLCDTHAEAALAQPLGTAARAHFYKWVAVVDQHPAGRADCLFLSGAHADAGQHAGCCRGQIAGRSQNWHHAGPARRRTGAPRRPLVCRHAVSALDAYVFTLCRWTRHFSSPAARTRPQLGPCLQRMLARPAVQRVLSAEELAPPFV